MSAKLTKGAYYCPSCAEFFNDYGTMSACVSCGTEYGLESEDCPHCGETEYEMSCPKCGRFGDEQGLDHAECWKKDIERRLESAQ